MVSTATDRMRAAGISATEEARNDQTFRHFLRFSPKKAKIMLHNNILCFNILWYIVLYCYSIAKNEIILYYFVSFSLLSLL